MAAKKYLKMLAGRITEIAATITSAGAGNEGDIVALDSSGRLDISVMPVGVTAEVSLIECSENLTAGDLVSYHNSSGIKVRKADATTSGKEADGFVLAGYTSGATATVYGPSNKNTAVTGLTPGSRYYLSTTAGGVTATAPSGSANVVQYVGKATAAGELMFEPDDGIVLAT